MFKRVNSDVVPFSINSPAGNRYVFGTADVSNDIDANYNENIKKGFGTGPNEFPELEDFNALMFTGSYLAAYLYQAGIPEWNDKQKYYINSIVMGSDGNLYKSLTGTEGTPNVDNNPTLAGSVSWKSILSDYALINGDETKKFKVATPEGDYDAVNKKYVDENVKLNINSFPEKTTPDNTDNLALQETGGLLKKVSFENLKKHIFGQVIQSSTVANMVTTAVGTDVDWNNLQATITPKSTTSKILITVTFGVGDCNPNGGIYLKRNSTKIGGTGITTSFSHPDNIWNMDELRVGVGNLNPVSIKYLDSPTSTNPLIYKIGVRMVLDSDFYLNRPRANADYGNFRATITLEEIL